MVNYIAFFYSDKNSVVLYVSHVCAVSQRGTYLHRQTRRVDMASITDPARKAIPMFCFLLLTVETKIHMSRMF